MRWDSGGGRFAGARTGRARALALVVACGWALAACIGNSAQVQSTASIPRMTSPSKTATTSASSGAPSTVSMAPPYIAQVWWEDTALGETLKILPTAAGRQTGGSGDAQVAWAEVTALEPRAESPGMWEQFVCHWNFARLVEPEKPTWNIEPWRPVVDDVQMIASACNPGGPEV